MAFFLLIIAICVIITFLLSANSGSDSTTNEPTTSSHYYTPPPQNHNHIYIPGPETHNHVSTTKPETGFNYDDLTYTDDIMIRFCRAENKELICVDINTLEKYAIFKNRCHSYETYRTTLKSCTCPDQITPCKHMLYLANHLGHLEKWKKNLPRDRYNKLVQSYNNCQYRNDPEGWVRDKTIKNNWHPGRTRIGGCW